MSEPDQDKGGPTRHERLKTRLLNNWAVALLLIGGGAIVYVAGLADAVQRLIEKFWPAPALSMVATTTQSSEVCFLLPLRAGEEVAFQRSVIDVAFNNLSGGGHIIKSARLEPVWMRAGTILDEMQIEETYEVDVTAWHQSIEEIKARQGDGTLDPKMAERLKAEDGDTWVRPDPIEIAEVAGKYKVPVGAQERFQLRLGLPRAADYVLGDVRLHLTTDTGAELVSEPMPVTVCKVDPAATAAYKAAQAAGGGN